ncbi:hypothetical protein HII31_04463 [Pseudocercospora fuligena]|uniref:Uncharacterized protein n=1 Tax=Pseudocercospora fuligena TaxID=685502 RepID=A0A8H6RQ56_9PEZI|nr:hypothetical protein HII31_04463 [Pseudocercospora fuligena]
MASSSVAQISALINASLTIVKLTYPLLVSWIAAFSLKPKTNVATWSVFGKLINDSLWPTLLRTDTASGLKVHKGTQILSWLSILAAVLLAIAAVVTPLGLHDTIKPKHSDSVQFQYFKDVYSPIGRATPERAAYNMSRKCGNLLVEPCPGHSDGYSTSDAYTRRPLPGEEQSDIISTSIPSNITEVFGSGADSDSGIIASALDIQYRFYMNYAWNYSKFTSTNHSILDGGRPRTQGRFRYTQDFKLEDRIIAVEGLIVSMADEWPRGVGFRNHTLPTVAHEGFQWEEKILWLEPVTACTDLNITLDFIQAAPDEIDLASAQPRLTDRGGWVKMPRDYPWLDLNDTQTDLKLRERSWKAAVLTNNFALQALNETRNETRLGRAYRLDKLWSMSSLNSPDPYQISFSSFGSARSEPDAFEPNLPGLFLNGLGWSKIGVGEEYMEAASGNSSRTDIDTVVSFGGADNMDLSIAGSSGGLLLGAGLRVDSEGVPISDSLSSIGGLHLDVGTHWQQRLYSCMSSVKASIMDVEFEIRGSVSLEGLNIRSLHRTNQSLTWAIENTHRNMSQLDALWGLVGNKYKNSPNISTIQRPYLYLPAGLSSTGGSSFFDAGDGAAGASAAFAALHQIYSMSSLGTPDVTGSTNWALSEKWSLLSRNASSAGKIIDTIWTDLMANAVVGARSALSQPDGSYVATINRTATSFVRGVTYDWRFAIPALVFAAAYLALLAVSVTLTCTRRTSFAKLRALLNSSAAGRTITLERSRGRHPADYERTRIWARERGDELVDFLGTEQHEQKPEQVRLGSDERDDQHADCRQQDDVALHPEQRRITAPEENVPAKCTTW